MRFAFLNFSWDGLLVLTGEQLRIARETAGITQETLARQIGVSMRSVGNWERGEGVPRNREQRVREVLKGYWPGEVDSPSRAEDLKSVSDARLLAEIARRFERREDVGNDGSASKTQAGESPAAPTEDELDRARRAGREDVENHVLADVNRIRPNPPRHFPHELLHAAYAEGWGSLTEKEAKDLRTAAEAASAGDATVHELPNAEALGQAAETRKAARRGDLPPDPLKGAGEEGQGEAPEGGA